MTGSKPRRVSRSPVMENVRRIKARSIEELAEDIAGRALLQSLTVRPVCDAEGNETGMFEIPTGGRCYRALELLVKQERLAFRPRWPCGSKRRSARLPANVWQLDYELTEVMRRANEIEVEPFHASARHECGRDRGSRHRACGKAST